jgi:hypothetical protein
MAMFDWAGITLLDTTSWRDRPADRVAQENLVDMLRRDRRVSRQHIEAVEREVGCFRYRSEEVAAGSASQVRPLTFDDAEAAGQRILEVANEIYANA